MGKPLISSTAKLAMYETMQHLRAGKSAALRAVPRERRNLLRDEPESVLAALVSQVHVRDTILPHGDDPLLLMALEHNDPKQAGVTRVVPVNGDAQTCEAVAFGYALRQKVATRTDSIHRVAIALLRGTPPPLKLLPLLQQHEPSLVVLISGGEPQGQAEAQVLLRKPTAPVMVVDRSDTIAVCRVLQESLLRARNGWGGAVIHAASVPGAADCMSQMEEHLRAASLL